MILSFCEGSICNMRSLAKIKPSLKFSNLQYVIGKLAKVKLIKIVEINK